MEEIMESAMPEVSVDREEASASQGAYLDSRDHLWDELRRLDLLIHLRVLQQRHRQPSDPLDRFKGLVLSDQEITSLLSGPMGAWGEDAAGVEEEQEAVAQDLSQFGRLVRKRRADSLAQGIALSLPLLAGLFHLTPFEEECLLICLAPELDRKYEKLYAYLQDDITRKRPSVDLMLNLLCQNHQERIDRRVVFDPRSPLPKYQLLQMAEIGPDGEGSQLSRTLKLDDRIVNYLLGFGQIDARLEPVARMIYPQHNRGQAIVNEEVYRSARDLISSHFSEEKPVNQPLVFYFHGAYGAGRRATVERICHDMGLPFLLCNAEKMLNEGQPAFREIVWLFGREALLQPAVLCLENMGCLLAEPDKYQPQLKSLLEAVGTFSKLTFLLGDRAWQPQGLQELMHRHSFIPANFPPPDAATCRRLWEEHLKACDRLAGDVDSGELAGKFRFAPGQIRDVLAAAGDLARWRSPDDGRIAMVDLYAASRAQSSVKLGALARKIDPRYGWEEIVVPDDQLAQLEELCHQARYRHLVYGEWGFDRKLSLGKGINALFSGPPGTGKTMAAEVIAHELQLDLYQIDLSQVVSKYIGETEKNLHSIFREAQASNAILFFDEADALFGKRSEVKDAHDRYANIEVGYLLQKMEEYEGIAILATNMRRHLDEAFVRRMRFIVEFPFPDEEHRRRIWEVTFPREAPLSSEIDFSVLAREIKLAGGNIKNIAVAAAFYAASEGAAIDTSHLIKAARREHQKLGRMWNETMSTREMKPV
jgi:AAA+ superfamily predicted ATPase